MPSPVEAINPEGCPPERFTPCNAEGPFGWINHLGHIQPIRCNRPHHATGDHAYSTKRVARKFTWAPGEQVIFTTSRKGPWQAVKRIE